MAIYRARKNGDVMGSEIGRRPGRKQRQAVAVRKFEESIRIGESGEIPDNDSRSASFASRKFQETIRKQKQDALRMLCK